MNLFGFNKNENNKNNPFHWYLQQCQAQIVAKTVIIQATLASQ